MQAELSLDSDSEENEESRTTIKMLKRRVRCFATKPQIPSLRRHSMIDSKVSILLPADKWKGDRSGDDKGAIRKRPVDNNKRRGETETKKQARIGDGIGSGRGSKAQKSACRDRPMRSDASAEDRREVDGSSEDLPGGTASGTEARRSSSGGGMRAGGNATETGYHERRPPTAVVVRRVRLSKEEHMAALPGFGLQLGTTASIEVKWIVELGKGKSEVRSLLLLRCCRENTRYGNRDSSAQSRVLGERQR